VKLDRRQIASFPAAVSLDIVKETSEGQRAALARLMQSRQRSDAPIAKVPLVVLTRGRDSSSGLVDTHAALARLSSNSRQTVVADTFHEIHLSNPAAVIQAIQDVVAAAAQKSPLAKR
jgi:pimeloyl-ACP methyl ester carboxylesterase